MKIVNSKPEDIDEIFRLYGMAVAYQKTRFSVHWPEFDRKLIETEIVENRQWKMIVKDSTACVWATTFSDPQIWEERNDTPAVYIHRIATNPDFRGKNLVQQIVDWAKNYALLHGKLYVRLDTVGDNEKLISHYTNCGFNFLGMVTLRDTTGLPEHYRQGDVCLFELFANG